MRGRVGSLRFGRCYHPAEPAPTTRARRPGLAHDLPTSSRSSILDDRSTPPQRPPGLFASIRSTRDAGFRLAMAHVDLAKAEAQAIGDEVKKVAALIGIAVAVILFAAILAVVGTSLFLAEWLLGSMGWGVLHGIMLFAAIGVACALAAVGVSGGRIGRAFVAGLVIAIVVAIVMGLALPNRAYVSVGDAALAGIEPGVRPLVVGVLIVGALGLILGVIGAARGGGRGAIVGGLVVGVVLGALSAVNVGPQVGVGIGIALGYIVWIALMVVDIAGSGVDTEALKARFYPKETIETSKETLAWLQSKMPPGIGS